MLTRLLDLFARDDPESDPFARLDGLTFDEDQAILRVSAVDFGEERTPGAEPVWSRWEVRAMGLRDFRVCAPSGALALTAEHVVARAYVDTYVQLFFRGKPRSTTELIGLLWTIHREATRGWVEFERYWNRERELDALLAGGFGLLASGPEFLLSAYASALERAGVTASMVGHRPASRWDDRTGWTPVEAPLRTLLIGRSYFVAVDFEAKSL
jgi:hypothetical protein